MKKIALLVLTYLIFLSKIYAGTIHPSKSDRDYIAYGETYKHVAKLTCKKEKVGDKKEIIHCASAVVISKNWALTAAHIVKDMDSAVVSLNKKNYNSDKIIWHKDFKEEVFGTNDIALIYIKNGFDLDFYPELYRDGNEVGKVAGICGYGMTGDFNTGAKKSDDFVRAGTNMIDGIENNLIVCDASYNNITTLEFIIAHGDSGGGLFIDGKLAGINSMVFSDNGRPTNSIYSNKSGHTRISKYLDWIKEKTSEQK